MGSVLAWGDCFVLGIFVQEARAIALVPNLSSMHERQSDASLKVPVDSMQQCHTFPLHHTCRTLIKTSWELSLGVPSVPSRGRQVGDRESPSCSCLLAESQVSPSKMPAPLQSTNNRDGCMLLSRSNCGVPAPAHYRKGAMRNVGSWEQ